MYLPEPEEFMLPKAHGCMGYCFHQGENLMKKTIAVRIALTLLLLVASGSAPVLADIGGGPVPWCWPNPCSN